MGGPSYERDVPLTPRTRQEIFSNQGYRPDPKRPERREVHPLLNIKGKTKLECCDSQQYGQATPIVIALDVTKSRGEDSVIVHNKLPGFIGRLVMTNTIKLPEISWAGIGDATFGDHAPLQISQFESDTKLDEALAALWIEEGGGGTGQESYELAAYYYARHAMLDCLKNRREKGYFFFLGDEGFYPAVAKDQVKVLIGDDIHQDISSSIIFAELQKKFKVFFVFPKKPWEVKVKDIDEEIKTRVRNAGGMIEGVSIRASLLWNNFNDLDLHVICPSGEEIYYGHKNSHCGGFLDVDMNVRGETEKPVENIRWEKGKAPKGHYRVYVQNYATHGDCAPKTKFRVEIEIDGKVQHFEGETPAGKTHESSNTQVFDFDYDPKKGLVQEGDKYSLYKDEVILAQWGSVLPQENILVIEDARSCIDVMLGAIILDKGTQTLEQYVKYLGEPIKKGGVGQTSQRCKDVTNALEALSKIGKKMDVNSNIFSKKGEPNKKRSSRI
ncbi:MAG: YfaP family protein [Candidatus Nanoarchaeia archaeon]